MFALRKRPLCASVLFALIGVLGTNLQVAGFDSDTDVSASTKKLRAWRTISEIVNQHETTPDKICSEVTPIVIVNPRSASELISEALIRPKLRPRLAQCLAEIQRFLKANNPEAARSIAAQVSAAPQEFQAEYAITLVHEQAFENSNIAHGVSLRHVSLK